MRSDCTYIFAARRHPSALYAVVVCLSITTRCTTETAGHRIAQTTPHDSPGTLVSCCRRSQQNSNGITPKEAPNAVGVG